MLSAVLNRSKISTIVLGRLTFSMNLYWQMIGRGTRGPRSKGTEDCTVIDPIRLTRLYPIADGYRPTLTRSNDDLVAGEDVGAGRLDPSLTIVEVPHGGPGPGVEAVDESLCRALMWNRGFGKLQCSRKPLRGLDVCGMHRQAPHGKVRGPIPQKKLNEFRKRALNPAKDSKQWYSRHLMWQYASETVPALEYLNERTEQGAFKVNDEAYERCLKKVQEYLLWFGEI